MLNQIQNSPVRSQNAAEQLVAGAVHHQQLRRSGKTLTFGNLLTFPLEGRMFYVQPIYVQAASGSGSFPQNKITVAVYGTTVAWGDTLGQAVSGLFGEGAEADEPDRARGQPATPAGTAAAQLAAALAEIEAPTGRPGRPSRPATSRRTARRRSGSTRRSSKAQALAPQLTAAAPSPSPSPSPSTRHPASRRRG